jgi:hypothetical protein
MRIHGLQGSGIPVWEERQAEVVKISSVLQVSKIMHMSRKEPWSRCWCRSICEKEEETAAAELISTVDCEEIECSCFMPLQRLERWSQLLSSLMPQSFSCRALASSFFTQLLCQNQPGCSSRAWQKKEAQQPYEIPNKDRKQKQRMNRTTAMRCEVMMMIGRSLEESRAGCP